MPRNPQPATTRRQFLRSTGQIAAATTLAGLAVPHVHAAQDNTLQVALIGCGGRGSGAAVNAVAVQRCPVKLVAMADVFQDRMDGSVKALTSRSVDDLVVPKERQFIGFDAYQKAMDCLRPGDVAIFATPLAFRWVHFTYAIEKGLNVFMEKPLTADGPTSRRMLDLNEKAIAKNLKVGVGLMSRHARHLQQLHQRIQDGELGDITTMYSYRMQGPIGSAFSPEWNGSETELLWQLRRFHSFIWASGGCYNDFYIHVIDHCCWMKNDWPVKVHALGGRHYRGDFVDQNFDSYSVEYTFADGTKLMTFGRCIPNVTNIYKSYAFGTKGAAIVSKRGDCGGPSSTYSSCEMTNATKTWEAQVPRGEGDPYQNEWNDLVDAILDDTPYNEVEYGVKASVVNSMGRMAAHTGMEMTYDDFINSENEYAPGADKFTLDSPAPVQADENGKYPVPMPGIITDREY